MPRISKPLIVAAALSLTAAACGTNGNVVSETTQTPTASTAPSTTATTPPVVTTHGEETHDEETHEESSDHEETSGDHDAESGDERIVHVVMTEFAFEPAHVEVSAGETVRFVISNEGVIEHEFRLSNHHRIEEHLAAGHDDHGAEGSHHEEGGDIFIEIGPGESGELSATFPQDTTLYTDIACLLPGHHEAGMTGELSYTDT